MSKHTPGPWKVMINETVTDSDHIETLTGASHYSSPEGGEFFNPYVAVVGSDGSVICDNAQYYAQDIDPKNANLIGAAPDLLEALELIVREQLVSADGSFGKVIFAAIARAKGEA